MITLSLRDVVRNAAAVFSGVDGAVTRQARQAGCSRQTVYDHARQVQRRRQPPAGPETLPAEVPVPTPPLPLDGPAVRRRAVTAFAMGISTRRIEDLLGVLLGDSGPDHSTIARWPAEAAQKARPVLGELDAACLPEIRTRAVDEIVLGGDRPSSASSRRA
jgi:hypothetical protein